MKMILCITLLYFIVFIAVGDENITMTFENNSTEWFYVHVYEPHEKEIKLVSMNYTQFSQGYSSIDGLRDYSLTRIPGRSSNNYMGSMV